VINRIVIYQEGKNPVSVVPTHEGSWTQDVHHAMTETERLATFLIPDCLDGLAQVLIHFGYWPNGIEEETP